LQHTIGGSYPNNHLLADGFAGWYCGTLYPEFRSAGASASKGRRIFLRELRRQFYADGANFEHSTHYHELGCEMVVAYVLLSRRNDAATDADVMNGLERMLAFQAALNGPEAISLPIGDTTEDPLFPLDAEHGWAGAAMNELFDYGRPRSISLVVLADRGGRELPVAADFLGAEVAVDGGEELVLSNENGKLRFAALRRPA